MSFKRTEFGGGEYFIGEIKDMLLNGLGSFVWADGSKYVGEWKDGGRHGSGILVAIDGKSPWDVPPDRPLELQRRSRLTNYSINLEQTAGSIYDGQWRNDKKRGPGILWFANGDIYSGEFKDDDFHGEGRMDFADGAPANEGAWANGIFVGIK